ncbi:endonuclease/exonuclease/phosphatase family metal-dependent hydrolase [Maribacter spongiicola]|uniref:Endonuclease/exonuclease/phosphatase family metal-dependent hydrolase n=1 Tax=Maribacter spongiicola TaxID=1206753 RepID=A0A4V3EQ63_9FLAO|nr:endonuclease/exonuclease/phosphatase family protein [Maribacter spongiicola]TDT40608.1 endonuclease/exonuclease/phosphatase family metal-dependent hydrolase [Maribacter spongiicola]
MWNNSLKSLAFILGLLVSISTIYGQEVDVLTYNIKYDNVSDTVNNWNNRKAPMVALLQYYNSDIIGMQEVLHHQLSYLDKHLTDYSYIGVGRDDGEKKGEYSPILFNTKKYKLLQGETFWLSETPHEISVGWDAAMERICTYGLFEDLNTGKQFLVFNTHFDHIGRVAREKSAKLIASKINEISENKLPVVLMGDLNLNPTEKPIQYLQSVLADGQSVTQKPFYGPTGTFSGFDHSRILSSRIDYIFIENFKVLEYVHIDDRMENNKHISDHLPVFAKLIIEQ